MENAKKTQDSNPIAFETALAKLQEAVKKLESGELSLDQALQSFEEGVSHSKTCQQMLTVAEQRVEQLMKATQNSDGTSTIETQPFASTKSK